MCMHEATGLRGLRTPLPKFKQPSCLYYKAYKIKNYEFPVPNHGIIIIQNFVKGISNIFYILKVYKLVSHIRALKMYVTLASRLAISCRLNVLYNLTSYTTELTNRVNLFYAVHGVIRGTSFTRWQENLFSLMLPLHSFFAWELNLMSHSNGANGRLL